MRYCLGTPGSARSIHPASRSIQDSPQPGNRDPISEFASFNGRCYQVAVEPFSSSRDGSRAEGAFLKELAVKIDMLERRLSSGPAITPGLEFLLSDAIRALEQAKMVRDELKGSDDPLADGAISDRSNKKPALSLLILNIILHRLDVFSTSKDKEG